MAGDVVHGQIREAERQVAVLLHDRVVVHDGRSAFALARPHVAVAEVVNRGVDDEGVIQRGVDAERLVETVVLVKAPAKRAELLVIAQVPFAEGRGCISACGEQLRKHQLARGDALVGECGGPGDRRRGDGHHRARVDEVAEDRVLQAVSRVLVVRLKLEPEPLLVTPGEHAGPRRRADGRGAGGVGERHALPADAVDVRRGHPRASVETHVRLTQIVCDNEDDPRRPGARSSRSHGSRPLIRQKTLLLRARFLVRGNVPSSG